MKAVKGGGAGPQFAQAVAAGAVAVIDFVANWLLQRLMKPAKKVSGKLAAMAKKIMAKLKKGLKKVGKKIKKAVKKIKKKAKGLLKKKGKKKGGKKKDKSKKDRDQKDDKKKKEDEKKRKKIERAQRELPPKVSALIAKKPSRARLKLTLGIWKIQYGMKSLSAEGKEALQIRGVINPTLDVGKGWMVSWGDVVRAIHEVADEYQQEYLAKIASGTPKRTGTGTIEDPIVPTTKAGPMALTNTLAETTSGRVQSPAGAFDVRTAKKDGKAMTSILPADRPKFRSYRAIIKDLARSGMSPEDIGKALGGAFAGAESKLTSGQAALIGEAQGLLAFEGTHPNKTMGHNRDVVHGMMASQSMAQGKMQVEELRQLPSAGMHSGKAAAANDEPARRGVGGSSIQAGAQNVTREAVTKQASTGALVPGDLPPGMFGPTEARLKREIRNFEKWMKATGDFEKVESSKSDVEKLKPQIKQRLDKFLASFLSQAPKGS